jgi:hypothetical protein
VILGAKPVVDLSDVNSPSLIAAAAYTQDDSSCLPPPTDTYLWASTNTLLRVYHYSGTKEQFFRDDPRLKCHNNNRTGTWCKNLAAKGRS